MNVGYPAIQHLFRPRRLLSDQFRDYRFKMKHQKRLHHRLIGLTPQPDPRQ